MSKNYLEHEDKVIAADGEEFKHVMAITLDPRTDYREGLVRCIVSREGNLEIKGYVDRSELHQVVRDSGGRFTIGTKLNIKNEAVIINKLTSGGGDFIGLEDPDIWIDKGEDLMHVYFAIPIKGQHTITHLGHALGKDLTSLEMTMLVLLSENNNYAKEVSIAPVNRQGFRYNLIESSNRRGDFNYSTVRVAIAQDMGGEWQYGETVFHPADYNISWIAGHASPGPLFPKSFIDIGEDKLLGVINGREANQKIGNEIRYGIFSIGLFIYDYEKGKIDWVSPAPFIQDSQAKIITFASQFVETGLGRGTLYAHIDDSFVRAYDLTAEELKPLLPKNS